MESPMVRRTRRLWSDEEKRSICLQTTAPDVSVAQVARRYAMNVILIFAWGRDSRFAPTEARVAAEAPCFLPVEIVAHVQREDERRASNDGQAKTSWNALMDDYRTSDRWTGLKPRTRADYDKVTGYLHEKVGTRSVAALTHADVIAAQKANAHRTRFANYIPQMFVVLCEHAIDLGWIDRNPSMGVRALKTPEDRTQAHVPWPDSAVEKFRAEASYLPRWIFEIGVGTVQRPDDWTGFTWGDYDPADAGALRLRQGMTGKPLVLPCPLSCRASCPAVPLVLPCAESLRATLKLTKASLGYVPIASRPILCSATGGHTSYRYLAQVMLAERRRHGLEPFDLHALRYRGIKVLALAGCSDDELASYSGHATTTNISKYAGAARQEMNARRARLKRQ